ncbi:hypothetical protein [Parasphingorhabdus sp.]|uniref:hypothetical protein n=1 Tax=Parasphingorhabdus sp. TaxID=2709688 RepID=UPI003003768C
MRYTTIIGSVALLMVPAAASAGECQPTFASGNQSLVINGTEIEPGGLAAQDFQVLVQNAAAGATSTRSIVGVPPCEAVIRIARKGAPPISGYPPFVISASGNNQVEILENDTSGGSVSSNVEIGGAPSWIFKVEVPTEWGLQAGTYVEYLELLLLDRNGDGSTITDRRDLTVTIVIPPAVSLRLVGAVVGGGGSNEPARVDLGNLSSSTSTQSEPFAARIFSTTPYIVSFNSINLGNMVHEQGRDQVPYRLFFDGALVNLAGTAEFFYPDHTPQGGDNRPMSVVVPPVVALAGRYSDRVTVTVTTM